MSNPCLTRRTLLVSGTALAVHSTLGLPASPLTLSTRVHEPTMAEIMRKYIAAELALPEPLVTDAMPIELLFRHVLAQEQEVEVQHAVDTVGGDGFRDTECIAVRLVMSVEEFFDVSMPDDAMETRRTVGDLLAFLVPRIPVRAALEALYQRCPATVEDAIQKFSSAPFAAPSLHQLLQTCPGQDGPEAVHRNL